MPSTPIVSIAEALERVSSESRSVAGERSEKVTRLEKELSALERARTNIDGQITALRAHLAEVERQQKAVQGMVREQGQRAIFDALASQQRGLKERANQRTALRVARDEAVVEELQRSTLAAEYEEYRQFKEEIEPVLQTLPASYRSVVLQHHHQVVGRLREHLQRLFSEPVNLDVPILCLDAVVCLDTYETNRLALIVVLPVSGQLASNWSETPEDLESAFAYRVVQGIYTALKGTKMQTGRLVVGDHQGLLVLEMDLVIEGTPEEVSVLVRDGIEAVLDSAQEIRTAHIKAETMVVDVDTLLPDSPDNATEDAPTERMVEGDEVHA